MTNIAILGFGVVGGGVAELITKNNAQVEALGGDKINIKHILDLREFPDSPFADRVTHDFSVIEKDPEVDCVIEVMGGSHPAYEYTIAAIKAGKHVISSNKEVVANFGDEFLTLAKEHDVCYKFEAAVGGGIPVIAPLISFVTHNNIREVRGILNGTTNYILTKMFSFGADFDESLADAQEKGYAERNPAADVEGLDAARKIVILTALATGIRLDSDTICCEGITEIDAAALELAEDLGCKIKLIAHFERVDGKLLAMVSPRLVPNTSPLYSVDDVFNGILVSTDMLGDVMFYGRGAGMLPTAGAVVADIIDVVTHKSLEGVKAVKWTPAENADYADLADYRCDRAFTVRGTLADSGAKIEKYFGKPTSVIANDGKVSFTVKNMSEAEANAAVQSSALAIVNKFRML